MRDLDSRLVLESEQEDLLATLVERARAVPRQERTFLAVAVGDPQSIRGPGGGFAAAFTDVQTLVRQGLLVQLGSERTAMTVTVAPEGFAYYDEMRRRAGAPPEQLDDDLRRYIEGDPFRTQYPKGLRALGRCR